MILRRSCNLLTSRHNPVNIKFYSLYPTTYIKPVFKKEEQKELSKDPENNKLSHLPIKAALTSDTCSEFHDDMVRKFTNYVMRKGTKESARVMVEAAFENIKIMQLDKYYSAPPEEKNEIILDPKIILHRAIENCTPILELTDVKRGGITYKVPIPISERRGRFISMRWLIETAKDKPNKQRFMNVLAKELIDAANNQGRTIKKKYDLHKQCEANRAYAHYRWI